MPVARSLTDAKLVSLGEEAVRVMRETRALAAGIVRAPTPKLDASRRRLNALLRQHGARVPESRRAVAAAADPKTPRLNEYHRRVQALFAQQLNALVRHGRHGRSEESPLDFF